MNFKTNTRGFTLIELLVVIAIIGILASVVLTSLNSARDKGKDAAAKSSISQARAAAEVVYSSNNNSYAGMCPVQASGAAGAAPQANTILGALTSAATAYGVTFASGVYDSGNAATPNVAGDTSCQSDTNEFVIQVLLSNGRAFCVDSLGNAGERGTIQVANLADGSRRCAAS